MTAAGVHSSLTGKLQARFSFTKATPVQAAAFPVIEASVERCPEAASRYDVALHSETGSGKTLAYLLPLLSHLLDSTRSASGLYHAKTRVVIVTPTRELAHQVYTVAETLCQPGRKRGSAAESWKGGVRAREGRGGAAPSAGSGGGGGDPALHLGTASAASLLRIAKMVGEVPHTALQAGRGEGGGEAPHVVIGTPQTLARLIPSRLNCGQLSALVLDEADELVRNNNIGAVSALTRWAAKLKHRPALIAVSATPSHGLATFLQDHARPKTLRTVNLLEATPRARVGLAAALRSQEKQAAASAAAGGGADAGSGDDGEGEGVVGSGGDVAGSGRKPTGGKAAAAAARAAASAFPLGGAAGRGPAAASGRDEEEDEDEGSSDAAARPLFISRDSWREGAGADADAAGRIHTGLGLRSDGRDDASVGLGDGAAADGDAASASESYYLSRASLGLAMPPTLHHLLLPVPSAEEAYPTLTRWLAAAKPQAVLSFHNSVESLEAAEVYLRGRGVQARVLGSAYDVKERHRSIADVSSGKAQVLLATEMGARGLDIPRLSHVLNFDAPSGPREYVHRAGRVGRLSSLTPGRRGTVVSMPVGASQYAQLLRMLRGDLQLSTAPVDAAPVNAQRGASRGGGGSRSGPASAAAVGAAEGATLSGAEAAVVLRANAAVPDSGEGTDAALQLAEAPIAAAAAAPAAAFAPLMRAECVHGELQLSLIPASSGGKGSGGGPRSGGSGGASGAKRGGDRGTAADKPAARKGGPRTPSRAAGE